MSGSTDLAIAVVAALRRGGVTDVVLAPGSRSAPLALALHSADAAGALRLHVRIDERTAGFLALGLAKGSRRPVAVLTTSGSAVTHLHPAVLEAVHVGEPLIVLSADRPAALRGTGANQTTDQVGIFGARVPCVDVAASDAPAAVSAVRAAVRRRGPTQLNLQFTEPLAESPELSSDHDGQHHTTYQRADPEPQAAGETECLASGPRTVLVAGDGAGPRARLLAERGNWPLLAEPTSGSRTGSHALRTYRLLLDGQLGQHVERVIVTGHPTLSRPVTRLISRGDIEVISVRGPGGICTDPGRVARHVEHLPSVTAADSDGWFEEWRAADDTMSKAVDDLVAGDPAGLPLQVAAAVAAAVTPEALLVVGSSSPVRDLDVMAEPYPAGQRRLILGNRGLSGIDGTVSTAIGAALGRRSSRSLAYVGDLTFLHDCNGLVLGPDEPRPDLTIVVANDDGGAIFATLEQGGPEFARSFERVFGTPHGVSLRALCAATRTAYERVDDPDELPALLTETPTGIRVLEVPISRADRRTLADRLHSLYRS